MFLGKVKFSTTDLGRHYGLCPKKEVPGVQWLGFFSGVTRHCFQQLCKISASKYFCLGYMLIPIY